MQIMKIPDYMPRLCVAERYIINNEFHRNYKLYYRI